MTTTITNYLELEQEFTEINKKISKLSTLIQSNDYEKLSQESQSFIWIQREAIRTYGACLVARMKLLQEEQFKEENKTWQT